MRADRTERVRRRFGLGADGEAHAVGLCLEAAGDLAHHRREIHVLGEVPRQLPRVNTCDVQEPADELIEVAELPGELLVIHDWKRPWRVTGNSSVYRFRIGAHPDLLAYFRAHVNEVRAQMRNEQAYLSDYLHKQGKLAYWPADWCVSWKYHCIPRFPANYWREPFIPAGARILVFHGVMNPPDALAGRSKGNWRFALPATWIAEHWVE